MSLFGTSPDDSPLPHPTSRSTTSLFADDPPPATKSKSSLFADDDEEPSKPPPDIPTPKKAGRGNLIKSLLPASDVPETYIDTFDSILSSEDRSGHSISLTAVKKILNASGLNANDEAKVLGIVVPGGQESATGLERGEFNVLLALIGLAQEHEDVTLDGVDERRKNLPVPKLPSFTSPNPAKVSDNPEEPLKSASQRSVTPPPKQNLADSSPPRSRTMQRDPLDFPDADPWGSPALHKGHGHVTSQGDTPAKANGPSPTQKSNFGNGMPSRTTSNITTASVGPANDASDSGRPDPPSGSGGGEWGSYDGPTSGTYPNQLDAGFDGSGFGAGAEDDALGGGPNGPGRTLGSVGVTSRGVEEIVTITVLPEKEGVFLFQHRNYEVSSVRRGSKVVRRYSDFVWLLDCLHKRYPFRQLPLLPPKRVAVNGNHLSSDASFIEKRRRGLTRFTNALVRHPVLCQEQLVVMFLTVPTELSVWRKQATISVQEEFAGKPLPPTLEDSLPPTLPETFETVRTGVQRSSEIYINFCSLLERLAKRNEGIAADHFRMSTSIRSLTETSESTYAVDTSDVPMLNRGLIATAKHLSASRSLLEDEAKAWDEGVLEDLKRQRDTLVSVRDMFDRRDRYARDNIPTLERRIENNENRLAGLRGRPEGTLRPGEIEKVEDAIIKDKQSIVAQHARGVFIRECIRDELVYFQHSQYHVSRLHQDWSQERVKYAELQADNWRSLADEVEGMPLGD
ncbi:MAG: Sorting nexin mvp1 [Sclerophora amabilis]|nr:MAG: Sorting nexin mvp1 [Sclerophora amabilis]